MNAKLIRGIVLIALTISSTAYAEDGQSEFAQVLLSLHKELHEFKDDPEFHDVGFATCCRFNKWLREVDSLSEKTDMNIIYETGLLPGELRALGMEYVRSGGKPTDFSISFEKIIGDKSSIK